MTAILEVKELSKRFGGHVAVDHVTFEISSGEAVALVGANGAGKTTLFRLISGEIPLDSGHIVFEGAALPARADARARRGIGRTFQIVELFGGLSVLDHLLVALQARDRRQGPWRDLFQGGETSPGERIRCQEILELCELTDFAETPATTLSLGQRRAVELARALITGPRLLLTDEPSSGLDVEESSQLVAIIDRVRRETGLAVLLIDHDLVTVDGVADRVIAMDAGVIIAQGTYVEVVNDPKVVETWLGRSA